MKAKGNICAEDVKKGLERILIWIASKMENTRKKYKKYKNTSFVL